MENFMFEDETYQKWIKLIRTSGNILSETLSLTCDYPGEEHFQILSFILSELASISTDHGWGETYSPVEDNLDGFSHARLVQ